jgi:hypothetical protein
VVSTTHEAFGEPALAAVRAMRFRLGTLSGRAADARVQIPVSFSATRIVPAGPPQEP